MDIDLYNYSATTIRHILINIALNAVIVCDCQLTIQLYVVDVCVSCRWWEL